MKNLTNYIVSLLVVVALIAFSVCVATARDVPITKKSKIVKIDKTLTNVTATISTAINDTTANAPITREYQPVTIRSCISKRSIDIRGYNQPEIVQLQ
jgi:hypothetical protein